jgi:hypothetical protein
MECELVGYFAKGRAVPVEPGFPAQVTEICSVSGCISAPPAGWIDRWLHNDLGFYNQPSEARAAWPEQAAALSLFAYRLLPRRFVGGRTELVEEDRFPVEPLAQNFVSLGFDVVSRSISSFFECSPLSCNGLAAEVPVNRYCLETLEESAALAERCSREEPEPGPYYVLEVLREGA